MVKLGNTVAPGVVVNASSASYGTTSDMAPQDIGLVGPANFGSGAGQGSGQANKAYYILNKRQSDDLFGEDSLLAKTCKRAMDNTARPIYAVAASTTEVVGEDLGVSADFEFANAPHPENPDHYSITVDSTDVNVSTTLDIEGDEPGANNALIDPIAGVGQLESAPSSSMTADYTYLDYQSALDTLHENYGEILDFVSPVQENQDVNTMVEAMVDDMEYDFEFAIGVVGAPPTIDTATFDSTFDNSRMQMYYPTRDRDGVPIIGSIAGMRASVGISSSAIRETLSGVGRLMHRLKDPDVSSLINSRINPIQYRNGTAKVVDDMTTVKDTNSDESGYDTGLARMIMDRLILTVLDVEDDFIGGFNSQNQRNALQYLLDTRLSDMRKAELIEDFDIEVYSQSSRTATVNLNVTTVSGLRNIINNVNAGERASAFISATEAARQEAQQNTEEGTSDDGDGGGSN